MTSPLRLYQQQAVLSASPAELVDKLYGIGVTAAQNGDAPRTRRVLVELTAALDREQGGEVAEGLYDLYHFALRAANEGDLGTVSEILAGLRDAWRRGVLAPQTV